MVLLPPVPESPNRQLPRKSSGTPRVGMHLYQNDEDDDVSVLTFHTIGTKEATTPSHHVGIGGNSSFVKSARESLERLISERTNSGDDDGRSLSKISEEGGSQFSSSSSSRWECDRAKPSSVKIDEKDETDEYDFCDDDTISLAESILDSANKVLSNIGSSPYYAGRKKLTPPTQGSPSSRPDPKLSSPLEDATEKNSDAENGKNWSSSYCVGHQKLSPPTQGSPSSPPNPKLSSAMENATEKNSDAEDEMKWSSPYYAGRKKLPPKTQGSPLSPSNPKLSSPMEDATENTSDAEDEQKSFEKMCGMKTEVTSSRSICSGRDNQQIEVSGSFLSSYFHDENIKPSAYSFNPKLSSAMENATEKNRDAEDGKKWSSPHYAGRKKLPPPTLGSPLSPPNPKPSSPAENSTQKNSDADDEEKSSEKMYRMKTDVTSSRSICNGRDNQQLEVSGSFLRSYFHDENVKPSADSFEQKRNPRVAAKYYDTGKVRKSNGDQHIQKLEHETNHLQLLLKERQLETKKASKSLGSSIKKANELLERLSADR